MYLFCAGAVRGHVVARKTDNLELNDEQKTRLLSLALEPGPSSTPPDEDEEKGDLLCDILRCPLPVAEHPHDTAKSVPIGFRSGSGPSLGELLRDAKTDTSVLTRIKEYAKALGRDARSDMDKDVFLAVYFAAIAGALVFHNEHITEHPRHDLTQFFKHFAQASWMRTDLRDLFVKAAEHRGLKGQSGSHVGV